MTGRRLYEVITAELAKNPPPVGRRYADTEHHRSAFRWHLDADTRSGTQDAVIVARSPIGPPAFDFLPEKEREAWNAAAKRLSGRR